MTLSVFALKLDRASFPEEEVKARNSLLSDLPICIHVWSERNKLTVNERRFTAKEVNNQIFMDHSEEELEDLGADLNTDFINNSTQTPRLTVDC